MNKKKQKNFGHGLWHRIRREAEKALAADATVRYIGVRLETQPSLAEHFASLRAATKPDQDTSWLPASICVLILACLAEIFGHLEQMVLLWQAEQLAQPHANPAIQENGLNQPAPAVPVDQDDSRKIVEFPKKIEWDQRAVGPLRVEGRALAFLNYSSVAPRAPPSQPSSEPKTRPPTHAHFVPISYHSATMLPFAAPAPPHISTA